MQVKGQKRERERAEKNDDSRGRRRGRTPEVRERMVYYAVTAPEINQTDQNKQINKQTKRQLRVGRRIVRDPKEQKRRKEGRKKVAKG
jgi:hypothetical protein